MTKLNYREGDRFSVPLKPDGYATGMIARVGKAGVLFGYFFGPALEQPALPQESGMTGSDAILIGRFGDLDLLNSRWVNHGPSAHWDRDDWPLVPLVREYSLLGKRTLCLYESDDPSSLPREVPLSLEEATEAPNDALMGAGAVERRLSRMLIT